MKTTPLFYVVLPHAGGANRPHYLKAFGASLSQADAMWGKQKREAWTGGIDAAWRVSNVMPGTALRPANNAAERYFRERTVEIGVVSR